MDQFFQVSPSHPNCPSHRRAQHPLWLHSFPCLPFFQALLGTRQRPGIQLVLEVPQVPLKIILNVRSEPKSEVRVIFITSLNL